MVEVCPKRGWNSRSVPILSITQKQNLSSAFGDWLNKYSWDWWATFTFKKDKSPYGAKKAFLRFVKDIKKDVYFFLVIEWHKWRGSVHCHSLIGNVSGIRRLTIMDKWYDIYGIARILPYNKNLGARYYLSKYLIKEMADWDFYLPKKIQLKLHYYKENYFKIINEIDNGK